jgi:hypothetical protein
MHKTISLLILCGCETLSIAFWAGRTSQAFEMLRKLFEPKKHEVNEQFRTIHNEDIRDLRNSRVILKQKNQLDDAGLGMWLKWGRQGLHVEF